MALKSLLVYLDPAVNSRAVLEVACDLRRRHRAHLAGLLAFGAESKDAALSERARALEAAFHEQATRSQLSHEVIRAMDDGEAGVVLEARSHDLLIIGQAEPGGHRLWPQPHHLLERALLKSGHPLIAVPLEARSRPSASVSSWPGTARSRWDARWRTRCRSWRRRSG